MKRLLFALLLTVAALSVTLTTAFADGSPAIGWCC
jgi:hypothetical protein